MSDAIVCDNCGTVLAGLDQNGEDENAEVYSWIRLSIKGEPQHIDACTRQCAHELLDGAFGKAVDEKAAGVAEIAKIIRDQRAEREAEDDE